MTEYEILLVDDQPDLLAVIASALEDEGYQVRTASNGEAAIEALSITDFDLVITDINMARTDGIAVLKKAKELSPQPIVMILTGNHGASFAVDALRHGADDYMLKPCKLAELRQRVANCLQRPELKRRHARPEPRIPQQANSSPVNTPSPSLPSPRTAYSENASMRGNGGQVPSPLKGISANFNAALRFTPLEKGQISPCPPFPKGGTT